MPLQSLLKRLDTREIEIVRVPDLLRMEIVKVFGHSILLPLVSDVVLMLGQAVDSIEPTLPVVFGQDVCGGADLAGDIILDSGPGVRGTLESGLTGPASVLSVKTPGQIQTDKGVLHFAPASFHNTKLCSELRQVFDGNILK